MKQFVLTLYVLRNTRLIQRTTHRLREACQTEHARGYAIEVFDLGERPRLEAHQRILALSSLAGGLPRVLLDPLYEVLAEEPALIGFDLSVQATDVGGRVKRRVTKTPSDIPGFDFIADGGVPHGRSTLVAGSSGAGKTVFSSQFLVEGIVRHREPGIFVTFEEQPDQIRSNMSGFDWDIESWEAEGAWSFVDASLDPACKMTIIGDFDFDALIARIAYAAGAIGARRAALDSIGTIFSQFPDSTRVRFELFRMISALRDLGLTSVLTAERLEEYGCISRHGVEEFAADNVVILRNVLEAEKRRRTIEILKMRGASHKKGEYPFTIVPSQGIVIIPHVLPHDLELKQESTTMRVSSGNEGLDEMSGGGLLRDSVVLASGATGTGKTILAGHFVAGAAAAGERALYLGFEESRQQLSRNALGCGISFDAMEAAGLLKVVCHYPEDASLSDHLVLLERHVQEFRPNRLVLDSISALERIASVRGFREFLLTVTSLLKQQNITGMFTTTSPMAGLAEDANHVSALTDSIVLLRLVELHGDMVRGMNILKMRGSRHDTRIRLFHIDGQGIHIGGPLRLPGDLPPSTPARPSVGAGSDDTHCLRTCLSNQQDSENLYCSRRSGTASSRKAGE